MKKYYVIYITPSGQKIDITAWGDSAVKVANIYRPKSNGEIAVWPVTEPR